MKRFSYHIFLLILLIINTSCHQKFQSYYYEIGCLPENMPPFSPKQEHKRVALVLGGGGARGMAHVGVLEEFQKAKIPIDLIVGCSAGSIVGALYANHPNAQDVKSVLDPLRRGDLMEIDLFTHCHALGHGNKLKLFLLKYLGHTTFAELKIPLVVVATDLYTGELVPLGEGPVAPAVHASSAFPFFFSPVYLYKRLYIDGGTVNPIPVEVARLYDVDIVVAVDLSELLPEALPSNLFGVLKRAIEIQFFKHSEVCVSSADIIIRPEVCQVGIFDEGYNQLSYEAGREAAREAIPYIMQMLSIKSGENVPGCMSAPGP
jgi:NTE family protein